MMQWWSGLASRAGALAPQTEFVRSTYRVVFSFSSTLSGIGRCRYLVSAVYVIERECDCKHFFNVQSNVNNAPERIELFEL